MITNYEKNLEYNKLNSALTTKPLSLWHLLTMLLASTLWVPPSAEPPTTKKELLAK